MTNERLADEAIYPEQVESDTFLVGVYEGRWARVIPKTNETASEYAVPLEAQSEPDTVKQSAKIDVRTLTQAVREEIARADITSLKATRANVLALIEESQHEDVATVATLDDLRLDIGAALAVASSLPHVRQKEWSTWPQFAPDRPMTNEEAIDAHFSKFENGGSTTMQSGNQPAADTPQPALGRTVFDGPIEPLVIEVEAAQPSRFTKLARKLGSAATTAMNFLHRGGGGAPVRTTQATFFANERRKEGSTERKKTVKKVLGATAIAVAALVLSDKELDIVHFEGAKEAVTDQAAAVVSWLEGNGHGESAVTETAVTIPVLAQNGAEAVFTIPVPTTAEPSPTATASSPMEAAGSSTEVPPVPTPTTAPTTPTSQSAEAPVEPAPTKTPDVAQAEPTPAPGENAIVIGDTQDVPDVSASSAETPAPTAETEQYTMQVCANDGFTDLIQKTRPGLSDTEAYNVYLYILHTFGPDNLIRGVGVYQVEDQVDEYRLQNTGEATWAPGVQEAIDAYVVQP